MIKNNKNIIGWILRFDGGCRGNPGKAGTGSWIGKIKDDKICYSLKDVSLYGEEINNINIVYQTGTFLDNNKMTNNQAEYLALIEGLEMIQMKFPLCIKHLLIEGDSLLVINQMKGIYRVKEPELKILHNKATTLLKNNNFESFLFRHIPRIQNILADSIANKVMNEANSFEIIK